MKKVSIILSILALTNGHIFGQRPLYKKFRENKIKKVEKSPNLERQKENIVSSKTEKNKEEKIIRKEKESQKERVNLKNKTKTIQKTKPKNKKLVPIEAISKNNEKLKLYTGKLYQAREDKKGVYVRLLNEKNKFTRHYDKNLIKNARYKVRTKKDSNAQADANYAILFGKTKNSGTDLYLVLQKKIAAKK